MLDNPRRTLVAVAAAAVLSFGMAPIAHADDEPADTTCGSQEAQVARAEGALARLTALFESKKDKVADAEGAVEEASEDEDELAKAEKRLAKAEAKASKVTKAKKAQLQRLTKAEARLAECQSELTA